jgi:S-DNA-T family DNA segregation ATPase FtsK/SpoIIIE
MRERLPEILGLVWLAVAVLILLSLATYDAGDLPFFVSTTNQPLNNFVGIIGAYLAGALLFLMGLASFAVPVLAVFWAVGALLRHKPQRFIFKLTGSCIFLLSISGLFSMIAVGDEAIQFQHGGIIGFTVCNFMFRYFGNAGAVIIAGVLLALSLLLATDFLILPLCKHALKAIPLLLAKGKQLVDRQRSRIRVGKKEKPIQKTPKKVEPKPKVLIQPVVKTKPQPTPQAEKPKVVSKVPPKEPVPAQPAAASVTTAKPSPPKEYHLPSIDVLDSPPPVEQRKIEEDLKVKSDILESTLRDFGIEANVVDVNQGPVVTRYELQPAGGVKVNRITVLSDDIALAMKTTSVRIVAPVPGKGTVGVEVPNIESSFVYLREILESEEYKEEESKLKLALGKSIAGRPVVADLASMPHLLIAGTTGSGKTVCVNSLIMSLVFNATPDELKFLMVDPKMVELAAYNSLPHLLCPVVTDPKRVSSALHWVVAEMENRYKHFAEVGVRNIDMYNERVEAGKITEHGLMPYIVVIIDELADLMLVAQADIESAITRLAQLSRAVGIHIILATQRPSVDVITGVIKANFPARISFKVATKVDSRTVLDMNGADKLLGRGDMLFLEPGVEKPLRAQGSLVSDSEIERVVNSAKAQRGAEYNEEILHVQKKQPTRTFEKDEVYDEAVRLVLQTKQASVSMLQRKLGLGYTRAARLIDMMEEEGIVGPYQGSKPRDIVVDNLEEIQREL